MNILILKIKLPLYWTIITINWKKSLIHVSRFQSVICSVENISPIRGATIGLTLAAKMHWSWDDVVCVAWPIWLSCPMTTAVANDYFSSQRVSWAFFCILHLYSKYTRLLSSSIILPFILMPLNSLNNHMKSSVNEILKHLATLLCWIWRLWQ